MKNEKNEAIGISSPIVPPEVGEAPKIGIPTDNSVDLTKTQGKIGPDHFRFAELQEEYIRQYVLLADTKAGFSFGIASVVLIALFNDTELRTQITTAHWSVASVFGYASILFLAVSCWFSFNVIVPRVSQVSETLFSFVEVSKRDDAEHYVRDLTSATSEELLKARAKHCYDTSLVCMQKYACLNKAIWFGVPGLAAALMALLAK
ncbi:MAG: Pycsar system effector family protein [Roseibium sp.]